MALVVGEKSRKIFLANFSFYNFMFLFLLQQSFIERKLSKEGKCSIDSSHPRDGGEVGGGGWRGGGEFRRVERGVNHLQCDQMVRLMFNVWLLATMKIKPNNVSNLQK